MSPSLNASQVRRALLTLAALSAIPAALAAQNPVAAGPQFSFLVSGRLEAGGDKVVTVLFEDGSEQSIVTGQGGTIAAGAELRPNAASPFAVRATAGLKYMTTKADNANIYLLRVPLELAATYDVAPEVHVGAGFVHHSGIGFHGGGIGDNLKFKDANGGMVEVGWRWVALTFTKIDYTDEGGHTYNASNAGISFTYTFGR
jgi:hypothetical protein